MSDERELRPPPPPREDPWKAHRHAQAIAWLHATPWQRLQWLEEMIAVAHASGALPRPRRGPWGDGGA